MSITFGELLTIFSILVTLTGIVATILWNLWRKITKNSEDLSAFKLKVSEEYVKKKDLRQVFTDEETNG
jgi:hypothetical protein